MMEYNKFCRSSRETLKYCMEKIIIVDIGKSSFYYQFEDCDDIFGKEFWSMIDKKFKANELRPITRTGFMKKEMVDVGSEGDNPQQLSDKSEFTLADIISSMPDEMLQNVTAIKVYRGLQNPVEMKSVISKSEKRNTKTNAVLELYYSSSIY